MFQDEIHVLKDKLETQTQLINQQKVNNYLFIYLK